MSPKVPSPSRITSASVAVFRLIRRLQQKNSFLDFDLGKELTIVQSFILLEVDRTPGTIAGQLINLFGLDQSTFSRHVTQLVKKKYLISEVSHEDARVRHLKIGPAGKVYLQQYDQGSDSLLAGYIKNLTKQDQNTLHKLWRKLTTSLGINEGKIRATESPLRRQMQCLAYALKLFAASFHNSGLNVAAWQSLSELYYFPFRQSQGQLSRQLGTNATNLAAIINKLESEKLLERRAGRKDKRADVLAILPKGEELCRTVERAYCGLLSSGLSDFSASELDQIVRLTERFVGETADGCFLSEHGFAVRKLHTEQDLAEARRFFVIQIVKNAEFNKLKSQLFAPDSYSFLLYDLCDSKRDSPVAVAEYVISDDQLALYNFCCVPERSSKYNIARCIEQLKELMR